MCVVGFLLLLLMLHPVAPTRLMVGDEEEVGPCGLGESWQGLHGKCLCEMR